MIKKKNILISGWYGNGNLGDEAILKSIRDRIQKEMPNAEIEVLSSNPIFTSQYHRVKALPHLPYGLRNWIKQYLRGNVISTLKGFIRADLLVLGGGGFLSDWQSEAPWYWLRQALLAKILFKKVVLYGIGAGPFSRSLGKLVTHLIINSCVSAVTVRDEKSRQWLTNIGVKNDLIKVTADPVVGCQFQIASAPRIPSKQIGFCVTPIYHIEQYWPGKKNKYDKYCQSLALSIKMLVAAGYEILFIPMQTDSDISFANDLLQLAHCNGTIIEQPPTIDDAVEVLKRADVVIAMRYHSAILSALQGIPSIPIIYHHKTAEFVKSIGLDAYAEESGDGTNWRESEIDPNRLVKNVGKILSDYENVRKRMLNGIQALKDKEEQNIMMLMDVDLA